MLSNLKLTKQQIKQIKKDEDKSAPRETWFLEECKEWKKKHRNQIYLVDVEMPKFLMPEKQNQAKMSVLYYERRMQEMKKLATEIDSKEKEKLSVYKQRIELNKKFNSLIQEIKMLRTQLIDEALKS